MKVDLILKNGWVYRTYRQCFEKLDIAITGEKFYDISPVIAYDAEAVLDCTGAYIIPGLIDIHMHVESSMTYPREFSKAALPCGVTTVVADPHEIANVFGMAGIKSFMEQETELDIFYGIPSCVPATSPLMETSGGVIGEDEVAVLLKDDRVICLGEVMNYCALTSEEDTLIKRIVALCGQSGRKIRMEGHLPSMTHEECARFVYEGVDADHTQQTPESVLEKADMGMFLELQAKSLTAEIIKTVEKYSLYETMALVTDDTMPDHLVNEGQLNRILRLAVSMGMPAEKAVYASTLTPARRMHLDDRGIIAPGKLADLVILPDLVDFIPTAVYKNGRCYCPENASRDMLPVSFPEYFYRSVHCRKATQNDFILDADISEGIAVVNVMQLQTFGTRAAHVKREIPVHNGHLQWKEAGLCLAVIYERYGKNGNISYGLAEHALTRPGAIATTWSHDSHNLLVLGNSPEDMVLAQNYVLSGQGGYAVAAGNHIQAFCPLSIGGVISAEPVEVLAGQLENVRYAMEELGYENNNVIMSLSTLSLLVSPELKLSDKGLFDVRTQCPVLLVDSYKK